MELHPIFYLLLGVLIGGIVTMIRNTRRERRERDLNNALNRGSHYRRDFQNER